MSLTRDSSDRAAWEADRRHYLGASDAPAVLGLSPWRPPIDVWLHKTGRAPDQRPTLAMRRGNALEGLILDLYSEQERRDVVTPNTTTLPHPTHPHVACTPDGWVAGDGLVECKDVGQHVASEWAAGVPTHVEVQVRVQLAITGRAWCDVAAMISGRDAITIHRIHAGAEDDRICAAMERWWETHVAADVPPPLTGPTAQVRQALNLMHPTGAGVVTATAEDLAAVIDVGRLKALERELRDEREQLENLLRDRIGDAEELCHPDTGAPVATWRTTSRVGEIDWAAVAEALGADMHAFNAALVAATARTNVRTLRTNPKRAK